MNIHSEKRKKVLPGISLILSILLPFFIIQSDGFPYLGFALLFTSFSTLIYFLKPAKNRFYTLLYVGILMLSFFLIIRSQLFLTFLNIVCLVFFCSVLLLSGTFESLITLILSPMLAFLNTLKGHPLFTYRFRWMERLSEKKEKDYSEHFFAIILTGVILIVTIPLLSYANPYFNELVKTVMEALSLSWFFEQFHLYIIRTVLFLLLLFLTPKILGVTLRDIPNQILKNELRINFLIPKAALAVLLAIFFVTQAQLYFSTPEVLASMGYTNSQYTREVFAQLSFVAGIVFLLIYADRSRKMWREFLTYILIIESIFLSGMALKSVYEYTVAFGFTHKRLYGYAVVAWISSITFLFTYHYHKKTQASGFLKSALLCTLFIVIGINAANFDYLIYHYRKTTLAWGVDHFYLSHLSPDAQSYEHHLNELTERLKNVEKTDYKEVIPAYNVVYSIEDLQRKYKNKTVIGAWNLSEFMQYQQIKDINTEKYRSFLYMKHNSSRPFPTPEVTPSLMPTK